MMQVGPVTRISDHDPVEKAMCYVLRKFPAFTRHTFVVRSSDDSRVFDVICIPPGRTRAQDFTFTLDSQVSLVERDGPPTWWRDDVECAE